MENIAETVSTGEAHDNDDVIVDDTEGGVVLLEANRYRKSALITNVGTQPMRVTTDGSSPSATHGKRLIGGASLLLSSPYCSTNEVKACQEGVANTVVNVSEVD